MKENKKAILARTQRSMLRVICGRKIVDRKTTEKPIDMLGLNKTVDELETANEVGWYRNVLRRDDDSV